MHKRAPSEVYYITNQATGVGGNGTAHSDELSAKCYSLLISELSGCGFHQQVLGEDVRRELVPAPC